MLGQCGLINTRFIVHSFGIAQRTELRQIFIARHVFRQQHLMVTGGVFFVVHARRGYIKLTANNRLNPLLLCLIYKFRYSKHIAMVGNGNSWHALIFRFLNKLTDAGGTVEHTELCMTMEVRKIHAISLKINTDTDYYNTIPFPEN